MHPELRASAAHVFVADIDSPELSPSDGHHLRGALRLRVGQTVTVSDGAGAWRTCRFTGDGVEASGPVEREAAPDPAITIGFVPVKGDRADWTVQKLTELGVDRMVVLTSDRSVVRWGPERAQGHLPRLRRVAREAAGQSRRVWLPVLDGVAELTRVVGEPGVALADPGGQAPDLDRPFVLVGPEGGWTEEERARAAEAGVPEVVLGPTVLRSETAALAAATILIGLRSGVVGPGSSDRGPVQK